MEGIEEYSVNERCMAQSFMALVGKALGMAQVLWWSWVYFQCGTVLCASDLENDTYETPGWRNRGYLLCKIFSFAMFLSGWWESEVLRSNPSWKGHISIQVRRPSSRMHLVSQRGPDKLFHYFLPQLQDCNSGYTCACEGKDNFFVPVN